MGAPPFTIRVKRAHSRTNRGYRAASCTASPSANQRGRLRRLARLVSTCATSCAVTVAALIPPSAAVRGPAQFLRVTSPVFVS
jgi:hypothetical protein